MTSALNRAAALALATAVVLTGTGLGSGAAVAETPGAPGEPTTTATADGLTGPFVTVMPDSRFSAVGTPVPAGRLSYSAHEGLAQASAAASVWTFPAIGSTGQVRGTGSSSNTCLQITATPNGSHVLPQVCQDTPSQQFSWVDLRGGKTLTSAAAPTTYMTTSAVSNFYNTTNQASQAQLVRTDLLAGQFSARVDSVDVASRTARLSGSAVPGSYVVVNGREEVLVDGTGRWAHQLTGLALGTSTVGLEQWENGAKTGETTVTVTLPVAAVTASVSFPADPRQEAVLSGGAQPGATVVVADTAGAELARTTALLGSGSWSTSIPAPGAGGDRPVRVFQEIDGEKNGEIAVTVRYGAAVTVTSPVDGQAHGGGRLAMTGRGEHGATIVVRVQGTQNVIGTATVLASGAWNLTTTLDDRRHTLETTQTGKGDNVTVATTTINPDDEGGVSQPFILDSPADGQTIIAPGNQVTFAGRGTTGDTVQITNTYNGRVIDTTTIGQAGTWTAHGTVGAGTQNLDAAVTHRGTTTHHPFTVVLKTSTGTDKPFAVTTPADGSTVTAPQGALLFSGTGTAGATVVVRAGNGREVVKTVVRHDGTWSGIGYLYFMTYTLTTSHAIPGGATAVGSITLTVQPDDR